MSEIVRLPWLDLWQRGDGIFGALGGLRLELLPIEDAKPDGPHWRLYVTQRIQGLDRDRARPTRSTEPAPTGWDAVHERRSMTKQIAAIGMQAPHYSQDELQRDFGFEPEPRLSSYPHRLSKLSDRSTSVVAFVIIWRTMIGT